VNQARSEEKAKKKKGTFPGQPTEKGDRTGRGKKMGRDELKKGKKKPQGGSGAVKKTG